MSSDTKYGDGEFALNSDDVVLNDVIDITAIDLSDQERWLVPCDNIHSEADVNDIRMWLQQTQSHDEASFNCISDVNKQLIDTRTWTRPKKRFSKLNFESLKERTPSPSQSMKNDIWQLRNHDLSSNHSLKQQLKEQLNENSDEAVPPMLRLSMGGSSSVGCTTTTATGQESLEAFLNMSQSNGIDSFINMEAPEFNETLLVSVPRSSIVSTSSLSSIHIQDDNNYAINQSISMTDSQILTESMMHTSIFNDMTATNFDDAFARDNNLSVIENPNYFNNKSDKTIVNENDIFDDTRKILSEKELRTNEMSATFVPDELSKISNLESFIGDQIFDANMSEVNHLSYIVIEKGGSNDDRTIDCLDTIGENSITRLNATFDAGSSSSREFINSSRTLSTRCSGNLNKTSVDDDDAESLKTLNTTYSANEVEIPSEVNETFRISLSNPVKTVKSIFKVPLSINNQNLNSINSTFVAESNMHETYDNVPSMPPPPVNLYQTYKRCPGEVRKNNLQPLDTTFDRNSFSSTQQPLLSTNRYQTYRKNSAVISQTKSTNIIPLSNDPPRVVENQAKSMENLIGMKPNMQIPRKLNAPKHFSRLPQSLQKSNPNLTSSNGLKMTAVSTRISNFGFNRQRIIKNVDPHLANKLYSISKLSKCGSEQILDNTTTNSKYLETGGSTESIESTHSAHSAPDLDDRLSVCSDSSHNSYSQRTMNIDELHKIVQRQEESLKRESMADRKILENTWIASETNLPSPIFKVVETSGGGSVGSRGSSPGSGDSTVKTSSPILSLSESLHLLATDPDRHLVNHETIITTSQIDQKRRLQMPNRVSGIPEHKSGIRQPLNRDVAPTRGIPRPVSRIPAPRFSRANVKSYVETKKNIL